MSTPRSVAPSIWFPWFVPLVTELFYQGDCGEQCNETDDCTTAAATAAAASVACGFRFNCTRSFHHKHNHLQTNVSTIRVDTLIGALAAVHDKEQDKLVW